jgi:hypothetical protein
MDVCLSGQWRVVAPNFSVGSSIFGFGAEMIVEAIDVRSDVGLTRSDVCCVRLRLRVRRAQRRDNSR